MPSRNLKSNIKRNYIITITQKIRLMSKVHDPRENITLPVDVTSYLARSSIRKQGFAAAHGLGKQWRGRLVSEARKVAGHITLAVRNQSAMGSGAKHLRVHPQ